MSVFDWCKELDLLPAEFIVEGSGVLDALGIRESRDLDVVVDEPTFEALRQRGYAQKTLHGNIPYLAKGDIEIWLDFGGKKFAELMEQTTQIKGYNFVSLDQLRDWKSSRGLEKDKRDIVLIDNYLKHSHRNV